MAMKAQTRSALEWSVIQGELPDDAIINDKIEYATYGVWGWEKVTLDLTDEDARLVSDALDRIAEKVGI
jgi:hypothetical protein